MDHLPHIFRDPLARDSWAEGPDDRDGPRRLPAVEFHPIGWVAVAVSAVIGVIGVLLTGGLMWAIVHAMMALVE